MSNVAKIEVTATVDRVAVLVALAAQVALLLKDEVRRTAERDGKTDQEVLQAALAQANETDALALQYLKEYGAKVGPDGVILAD
jgi:FlaG/FlaF family flagellin (archaellin)